jgi:3-oxoadipate enol-lactonase
MYEHGDKVGATDAFCAWVAGPEYRQVIDKALPPGAFELAVTDLDTFFQVELPALQQWHFTAEEATRIRQPVLSVVGSETGPIARDCHALIQQWMPHAEALVVSSTVHLLQLMNPSGVADGLARFFARHER